MDKEASADRARRPKQPQERDVSFPLGVFTTVTGVSGSGKSTLINDILHTSLDKQTQRRQAGTSRHKSPSTLEHLDRSSRGPVAHRRTALEPRHLHRRVDHIRKLPADQRSENAYTPPGRFSFNVKGGRCGDSFGDGTLRLK